MTDTNEVVTNTATHTELKEVSFFFRKVITKHTDDAGVVTETESKRPTVNIKLPFPTVDGLIEIISTGGAALELLQEAVANVITTQARELVSESEDITEANFPFDKVDWNYIANLPKAERKGGGIAKEVWAAFGEDFTAYLLAAGKEEDKAKRAASLLLDKFTKVKYQKPVIHTLLSAVVDYAAHATNASEFTECTEFLVNKADTLLAITDEEQLAGLL